MTSKVFVTLAADKCMVSHNPVEDKMLELSKMADTSMLLFALALHMVLGMEVVKKIHMQKVLIYATGGTCGFGADDDFIEACTPNLGFMRDLIGLLRRFCLVLSSFSNRFDLL
ncbi:hypothetical protein PVK06_022853 [Gossypium arboreum]|uniref:Uncharacterized protein n=1 Tax=Gossypium arboreum TaxID=29729 RepID=A0ABR0P9H8_GOSAR|nr:hypothetical protein PVK06_022853 [Gossypium arboreum]